MTTQELFQTLQEMAGRAVLDRDLEASILFDLTEPDPAQWHGRIEDGGVTLTWGAPPRPDITITASSATALGLFQKTINPMMAFMTGKIKVTGDVGKVAVLKSLLLKK